jgi:hypothetical protein
MNRPEFGLDKDQIERVVAAATRAPSILNCQPWRFVAAADRIDVFAVPERGPGSVDPTGRERFLSLGAAVLNLRLAITALGHAPAVHLMPSADDRTHVARVSIGGPQRQGDLEGPLYDAIERRQSSRLPFTDELVRDEEFLHLQDAAAAEGAWLDVATGIHRTLVLDVLHEADLIQRADPRLVDDFAAWTTTRANPALGIPPQSLGPRPHSPGAAVRDMTLGSDGPGRGVAQFEDRGMLAVLLTTGDNAVDWVRGGIALERVLLTATVLGLSTGILSHGTEVVDLRPLVRDPSSRWRHPQVVVRFGHGDAMPATPRLPVSEVLELV